MKVGVSVIDPGVYEVEGTLSDAGGNESRTAFNKTRLKIGMHFVVLRFFAVSNSGIFHLRNLTIYDSRGEKLDHRDEAYTTKKYPYLDPDPQIARLTGDYVDQGVDANGDGKYEFLTLDVGVNVLFTGQYTLTGCLYDLKGSEIVWSVDKGVFESGYQTMHLVFDGASIKKHGVDGPFQLRKLILAGRNMSIDEALSHACNTSAYKYADLTEPTRPKKNDLISGMGLGEILLTISIAKTVPVFSGSYSLDVTGIRIPPLSSSFNISSPPINRNLSGYAYDTGGIYMPSMPNNFSIDADRVKSLNVGLKKLQGSYENSDNVWKGKFTRIWVSSQAVADDQGMAKIESYLISPGIYQVKIFGDAADNSTNVDLVMTLVKKLVINGRFSLDINTTGFPPGNYTITAKALNGYFNMDELAIKRLSVAN